VSIQNGIKVYVQHSDFDRSVEIGIKVPFDVYAGSLYPNEVLREAVIAAFDTFLAEQRR
jgi:hypothetical protein